MRDLIFPPLSRLLLGVVLASMALAAQAESRAVLVGVSDYTLLDADLQGPSSDVALMVETLAARGMPLAEMTVLVSDASGLPADLRQIAPPTRAAILQALGETAARSAAGDTVVFYFSGHGGQAPDQSGDEGGGYDEIFLPADAAGWKGTIGAVENAILDDELWAWAQGLLAHGVKLIGIIDACHADTGFRGQNALAVARGLNGEDLAIPPGTASTQTIALAPPLRGDFVFLYAAQSDQRAFEYPSGIDGRWHGEFTLRLAEVLQSPADQSWAQVLRETTQAMRQGPIPQMPDGEGTLLQSEVFGEWATPRFAVQAGQINAGALQGLSEGTEVALFATATGGTAIGHAVLTKVTARTATLAAGAAPANWAEVSLPATPPALHLAAALAADPADGHDYALWLAALDQVQTPRDPPADLVPVLIDGGLALAGPDGRVDGAGTGTTPRVQPQPGETVAQALDRSLAAAAHAVWLQSRLTALAGRSLTGLPDLQSIWQRRPARGADCDDLGPLQSVDPAQGVAPCDQLWVQFKNVSGQDLDVSVLYFNADFTVFAVWPQQGLSNRLAPGESARAGVSINRNSLGADEMLLLAVPAMPGQPRLDLTPLADGDAVSSAYRGFLRQPAALTMLRQQINVRPVQ